MPEKVRLSAERDHSPSAFEFNGRLTNGDQVMAYVGSRTGQTHPPSPTPFTRHTVALWNVGAVADVALAARVLPVGLLDNQRLAVFADLAEECGCQSAEMLTYLRDPGPVQIRGCWAVTR